MTSPASSVYLSKDLSRFATPRRRSHLNCRVGFRCFREAQCEGCWQRKRDFIIRQALHYREDWDWNRFVTISFGGGLWTGPKDSLRWASGVRRVLNRRLFKTEKFLCVLSTARVDRRASTRWRPHLHIITSTHLSASKIRASYKPLPDGLKGKTNIELIAPTENDMSWLIGYLMDQNVRPNLGMRPRNMHLITASRPFVTGRPIFIPELSFPGGFNVE